MAPALAGAARGHCWLRDPADRATATHGHGMAEFEYALQGALAMVLLWHGEIGHLLVQLPFTVVHAMRFTNLKHLVDQTELMRTRRHTAQEWCRGNHDRHRADLNLEQMGKMAIFGALALYFLWRLVHNLWLCLMEGT